MMVSYLLILYVLSYILIEAAPAMFSCNADRNEKKKEKRGAADFGKKKKISAANSAALKKAFWCNLLSFSWQKTRATPV